MPGTIHCEIVLDMISLFWNKAVFPLIFDLRISALINVGNIVKNMVTIYFKVYCYSVIIHLSTE